MRRGRGAGASLALLALLAVAGCSAPPPPPRPQAMAGSPPAPAYHQPPRFWLANHMTLLGAQLAPGLPRHQVRECLLCHQAASSCDPCHAYVGAPAVRPGPALP